MSEVEKRPWLQMYTIAEAVVAKLRPACHRIEIAGSLRRRKSMVGDIEIVAIPIRHTDLFGEPVDRSLVDDELGKWPIQLHLNGQKLKKFSFEGTSGQTYTIDLFLQPDPATWGVNYLLRTGSPEFSKRMVTPKMHGGYKPDGFEIDKARVWRNGVALATPDEECIFDLWGMCYVDPEDRI